MCYLGKFLKISCIFILLIAAVTSFHKNCYADTSSADIPPIILSGLNVYAEKGPEAALKTWFSGGYFEKINNQSTVNWLKSYSKYYGKYIGYDLIKIDKISPTVEMVYFQVNLEKGPIFFRFQCYQTQGNWIVSGYWRCHTDLFPVLLGQPYESQTRSSENRLLSKTLGILLLCFLCLAIVKIVKK